MCFSETWFKDTDSTYDTNIDGFLCERMDRTPESGKSTGGGVCVYINKNWCTNVCVVEQSCSPDIELLTVGLRPHYLPREFNQIFVTAVYISPSADADVASSKIAELVNKLETRAPDAVKLVLGDFNHCELEHTLPHYYQYVNIPTRKDKILDKCYGNIEKAYKAHGKAGLGHSDHNLIHLLPEYRQKLKRHKPIIKTTKKWTNDNIETLRGCFECTDWDVFFGNNTIDEATEAVSNYIKFCENLVLPEVRHKIYPNNKPWITKDIRSLLERKHKAFRDGDLVGKRNVQKEINYQIRLSKKNYGKTIEDLFRQHDSKKAWAGLKLITGIGRKTNSFVPVEDPCTFANDLNQFYARFDAFDFRTVNNQLCDELRSQVDDSNRIELSASSIQKSFKNAKVNKAAGPDGVSGRILKSCHKELSSVFHRLFQWSLDSNIIPRIWKTSTVIPIPKIPKPAVLNDFRPIALTSLIMKCFEGLIKDVILVQTKDYTDPVQFAYCSGRGVDDAILTLMHYIHEHLDKSQNYVRTLFVDFSSAFNTIQPHLLIEKLIKMCVNPRISLWINNFLSHRTQRVLFMNSVSDNICTSTRAPQGCVLSPVLFSLYSSDYRITHPSCPIIKYADDTSLTGLISRNDDSFYRKEIDSFFKWCDFNFLELNVSKTKEMVFDFRKTKTEIEPICIHGTRVETVTDFKYLGTFIDSNLNWKTNTQRLVAKANQRMYFIRKLKSFSVCNDILFLFYQSVSQPPRGWWKAESEQTLCTHKYVAKLEVFIRWLLIKE